MNYKRKLRRLFFLLMRSRTPPISSEFRVGGGFEHPKPPLGMPLPSEVMDRGLTVFAISEVKNSLKCEPLHQALLQGCNKKSKFIHTQDLTTPKRRCYLLWMWRVKFVILLSLFNVLSFLSLFQSLSLYCPFEKKCTCSSTEFSALRNENSDIKFIRQNLIYSAKTDIKTA